MTEEPPRTMHDDRDPDLAGMHPGDDLLFDYVEQATGPAVSARIAEHLAVCAACRELVELSAIAAARAPHQAGTLEAMPAEASARVATAVDAEFARHLQRRAKAKRLRGARYGTQRWLAVGAVALTVVGGVAVVSVDTGSNSTSLKSAGRQPGQTTAQPAVGASTIAPSADATGATAGAATGVTEAAKGSGSIDDQARNLQASPFPNTDAAGDVIAYGPAGTDASTAVADVLVPLHLPCVATLTTDATGVLVATRLAAAPNVTGTTLPFFPNIAVICRNDAARTNATGATTSAPLSPFSLKQVPAGTPGRGTGTGRASGATTATQPAPGAGIGTSHD